MRSQAEHRALCARCRRDVEYAHELALAEEETRKYLDAECERFVAAARFIPQLQQFLDSIGRERSSERARQPVRRSPARPPAHRRARHRTPGRRRLAGRRVRRRTGTRRTPARSTSADPGGEPPPERLAARFRRVLRAALTAALKPAARRVFRSGPLNHQEGGPFNDQGHLTAP